MGKGIKKIICTAISAISISVMTLAHAACPPSCAWYIDGNLGATKLNDVDFGPGSTTNDTGAGININAGAKFSRWFALELGITKYSDIKIKNAAGTQAAKDQYFSYDFVTKGILPVWNTGVELFAKLGIVRLNSKISISNSVAAAGLGLTASTTNANGVFLGVGGDYFVVPNVPIIVQWTRAKGNSTTGNIDLYSIGTGYYFG